jgi:putative DNA primase/helicase
MAVVGSDNPVHPVREYLGGLVWDRQPRLESWLVRYLGCEDEPLSSALGICWAIGCVARIYEPGCKLDTVLILVGKQGSGKSSAIRTLASPAWFADSIVDTRNKDAYQVIRGVWLYEWGELDSLKRSENTATKAFVSSATDTYRPSHERNVIKVPRSTVFVGSTNEFSFLNDPSGSRRYWPRDVGAVDIQALARDRDQLWAEAVSRYRADESWWLNPALETLRAEAAADYEHEDPWTKAIEHHLGLAQGKTTLAEVMADLEIPKGQSTRAAGMRAASVMRSLGWKRRRTRSGSSKVREWYR